jgi:hypothetical protein
MVAFPTYSSGFGIAPSGAQFNAASVQPQATFSQDQISGSAPPAAFMTAPTQSANATNIAVIGISSVVAISAASALVYFLVHRSKKNKKSKSTNDIEKSVPSKSQNSRTPYPVLRENRQYPPVTQRVAPSIAKQQPKLRSNHNPLLPTNITENKSTTVHSASLESEQASVSPKVLLEEIPPQTFSEVPTSASVRESLETNSVDGVNSDITHEETPHQVQSTHLDNQEPLADSNRVDLVSDKEPEQVGTIHYLRQHHKMGFTDVRPERANNDKEAVAASQQYILDTFIKNKARHILPESYTGGDRDDTAAYISTKARFRLYEPGQPLNQRQIDCLHDYGAHLVYKHLPNRPAEDVLFHNSVTEAVQSRAERTARDMLAMADENLAVPYHEYQRYRQDCLVARNHDCKDAIQKVRQEFPNEDIFVMMGSSEAHDDILDLLREDDEHVNIQEHEVPRPIVR